MSLPPVVATVEMLIGGRDLIEPRLDPSGRWLAFVAKQGRSRSIVVVDLDAAEATAAGSGSSCRSRRRWPAGAEAVAASTGVPTVRRSCTPPPTAGCGSSRSPAVSLVSLWPADPDRAASAPVVAPDGSHVVFVVDQAEIWSVPLADVTRCQAPPVRRLDGGDHEFCLDPAIAPCGSTVVYQAWSPPDMPWDGAVVVTVDLASGERTIGRRSTTGRGSSLASHPTAPAIGVHDGDGCSRSGGATGRSCPTNAASTPSPRGDPASAATPCRRTVTGWR